MCKIFIGIIFLPILYRSSQFQSLFVIKCVKSNRIIHDLESFRSFVIFASYLTNKYFFKMPKIKTNSAAKKRFSLTGTGRIKRKHAFKRHILTKKSTKQKRNLTYSSLVAPSDESKIKMLLR